MFVYYIRMNKETLDILMYKYRIPYYVAHKHIIPYTHLPQSKELLRDIRNYTQDIKLIECSSYSDFTSLIRTNDFDFVINLLRGEEEQDLFLHKKIVVPY